MKVLPSFLPIPCHPPSSQSDLSSSAWQSDDRSMLQTHTAWHSEWSAATEESVLFFSPSAWFHWLDRSSCTQLQLCIKSVSWWVRQLEKNRRQIYSWRKKHHLVPLVSSPPRHISISFFSFLYASAPSLPSVSTRQLTLALFSASSLCMTSMWSMSSSSSSSSSSSLCLDSCSRFWNCHSNISFLRRSLSSAVRSGLDWEAQYGS